MLRTAFVALTALVLWAGTAAAETKAQKEPEQMIREGAERIMDGVRQFIDRLPRYLPPELLPNGDIIIRREKRAPNGVWPHSEPQPGPDGSLGT